MYLPFLILFDYYFAKNRVVIPKINAKLQHSTILGENYGLNNIKKSGRNLYFKNLLNFGGKNDVKNEGIAV